jgi:hypothetical protein
MTWQVIGLSWYSYLHWNCRHVISFLPKDGDLDLTLPLLCYELASTEFFITIILFYLRMFASFWDTNILYESINWYFQCDLQFYSHRDWLKKCAILRMKLLNLTSWRVCYVLGGGRGGVREESMQVGGCSVPVGLVQVV